METNDKALSGKGPSLQRAKRIFLVNIALFACLLVIAGFLFWDEDEATETAPAPPIPEKAWSLPELAYLKGEMQALDEHPDTMPDYEADWARQHAEQAIRRDREFDEADEALTPILVDEYLKGYTARFQGYYDTHAARDFGYRYGVKFNSEFDGLSRRACYKLLNAHRTKLEQMFEIADEATWRLFCDAFDKGFSRGYLVVKEGITVQSRWDKIELFDD